MSWGVPAGGWFHTGDQGFLDPEGFLTLTGRLKELINRGGEKISPIEVRKCLQQPPSVSSVTIQAGSLTDKSGTAVRGLWSCALLQEFWVPSCRLL